MLLATLHPSAPIPHCFAKPERLIAATFPQLVIQLDRKLQGSR